MRLAAGEVELELAPERGGGVTAFRWRGRDVFRPMCSREGGSLDSRSDRLRETGPSPLRPPACGGRSGQAPRGNNEAQHNAEHALTLAYFPLVPFSNRIAHGRFAANGRPYAIAPNLPGEPHPLHGFGWLAPWSVEDASDTSAALAHEHHGPDWPSSYRAEQRLTLAPDGYRHELAIANTGAEPMPAGLGLHPYFPRTGACLDASFDGYWQTAPDKLPTEWRPLAAPPDWFGSGTIDTAFTGRRGPVTITWPTHSLTIAPDDALAETVIYVPADADYFCVEPVSHPTDAINTASDRMRWLRPGERWSVSVGFSVEAIG